MRIDPIDLTFSDHFHIALYSAHSNKVPANNLHRNPPRRPTGLDDRTEKRAAGMDGPYVVIETKD